jgi:hypothetical protein
MFERESGMKIRQSISVSSVFPASAEAIWKRLLHIDTLKTITKPLMTFTPIGQAAENLTWIEGGVYAFKIRLFGVIPIGGRHRIAVKSMDKTRFVIQTHERNATVTVWNHRITLNPLPDGNTQYTDIVEMYAGRLTPAVVWWSKIFYRHRQRKWVELLHKEKKEMYVC